MTRHEQLPDHKAAVSEGEFKANFEAAVAKAFTKEDEAMIKVEGRK